MYQVKIGLAWYDAVLLKRYGTFRVVLKHRNASMFALLIGPGAMARRLREGTAVVA